MCSPFRLDVSDSYYRWRDAKLQDYPATVEALIVELCTPGYATPAEQVAIEHLCRKTNMAIYAASPFSSRETLKSFARLFGLKSLDTNPLADEDSISSISATTNLQGQNSALQSYIPYTDRPISWHTDGYYNPSHRLVRGMILHCVTPAIVGGINAVLDPEILYIRLRDEAPETVAILSRPDSMIIPANTDDTRPDRTGPVFSYDSQGRHLHMRYTHRTRSIIWHEEAVAAAAHLRAILDAEDVPYVFRHRLESGQGLICNNVLHTRASFRDEPHSQRLFYRARFLERVADTSWLSP
ncbi:FIG00779168: hypothetical protein [invertebrate metagenome]|uniref:TauD/TfdA-like domain-containing protein n=1 Tax=invertebrate metagenome TaxID=1711999 RepID=A0A484H6V8_9ZZZZ